MYVLIGSELIDRSKAVFVSVNHATSWQKAISHVLFPDNSVNNVVCHTGHRNDILESLFCINHQGGRLCWSKLSVKDFWGYLSAKLSGWQIWLSKWLRPRVQSNCTSGSEDGYVCMLWCVYVWLNHVLLCMCSFLEVERGIDHIGLVLSVKNSTWSAEKASVNEM